MDDLEKEVRESWANAVPVSKNAAQYIFDNSQSMGEAMMAAAMILNSMAISAGIGLPHVIEIVREVYHIGDRIKGEMMQ